MASTSITCSLASISSSTKQTSATTHVGSSSFMVCPCPGGPKKMKPLTVVAAAGELSSNSTTYLVAGAALVALVGTAFPIFFSRKDTCPECDGAGFVRRSGVALRANAARKDQTQIVCANCNGLGKLNQVDKRS
ncbi:uncharacterized protein LOC124914776 [Impatiens glandulifera]|uniref:uncharacterized protein LOC124914776 n=1 Tax=Impatiens glandulifera TaxID=253017 RepID=UPI001FB088B4|nr:uncharacterized protein LOC124914776 [Impatiens glandulifera]